MQANTMLNVLESNNKNPKVHVITKIRNKDVEKKILFLFVK